MPRALGQIRDRLRCGWMVVARHSTVRGCGLRQQRLHVTIQAQTREHIADGCLQPQLDLGLAANGLVNLGRTSRQDFAGGDRAPLGFFGIGYPEEADAVVTTKPAILLILAGMRGQPASAAEQSRRAHRLPRPLARLRRSDGASTTGVNCHGFMPLRRQYAIAPRQATTTTIWLVICVKLFLRPASVAEGKAMTTRRVGLFAGLLLLASSALSAASPIMLHNTGEGLVQGAFDANWTVVLPGGALFGPAISATDPNGAWIAPTPPNTWISIVGRDVVPTGTYRYSTTFTIGPGADLSTAELSGFWWADEPNPLNGIYLNGVNVSSFQGALWFDPNPASAAFTVTLGFVPGLNVLSFDVTNTGGPGGMLVQGLSGSVEPVVPEPASLLLLGTGLVGIRAWRKRRQ